MERKSRIDRYQALRDKMLETKIEHEKIDVKQSEEVYQPTREKETIAPEFKIDSFHNEYLDEFIREVKEYNIQKGTAISQDTQVNVLKNLIQEERDEYVEEIKNEPVLEDIFKQVESLIEPTPSLEEIVEEVMTTQEISPIVEDENDKNIIQSLNHDETLLDQTRKIEVKIDEYKENVSQITNKVNQTNIILNIIVAILIFIIVIIIGFAVFYVLHLRG